MIRRILAVAMAYVCDNRSFWRSGIIYGPYRQGLIDERQQILDYLGDDFLALEKLLTGFSRAVSAKNDGVGGTGHNNKSP